MMCVKRRDLCDQSCFISCFDSYFLPHFLSSGFQATLLFYKVSIKMRTAGRLDSSHLCRSRVSAGTTLSTDSVNWVGLHYLYPPANQSVASTGGNYSKIYLFQKAGLLQLVDVCQRPQVNETPKGVKIISKLRCKNPFGTQQQRLIWSSERHHRAILYTYTICIPKPPTLF